MKKRFTFVVVSIVFLSCTNDSSFVSSNAIPKCSNIALIFSKFYSGFAEKGFSQDSPSVAYDFIVTNDDEYSKSFGGVLYLYIRDEVVGKFNVQKTVIPPKSSMNKHILFAIPSFLDITSNGFDVFLQPKFVFQDFTDQATCPVGFHGSYISCIVENNIDCEKSRPTELDTLNSF